MQQLRIAAPIIYVALLVGGFLIGSKVGAIVAVVGAMLLAAMYASMRKTTDR